MDILTVSLTVTPAIPDIASAAQSAAASRCFIPLLLSGVRRWVVDPAILHGAGGSENSFRPPPPSREGEIAV
jgi:hypothetical protein